MEQRRKRLKNTKQEKSARNRFDFSPTVEVSKTGKVTTVTITDKDGTHTATINDGADGINGTDGQDGAKGDKGADGVSPTISAVRVSNGVQLTITDKNGSHSAVLNDGIGDGSSVATFADVPNDGKSYLRQNGTWVEGATKAELAEIGAKVGELESAFDFEGQEEKNIKTGIVNFPFGIVEQMPSKGMNPDGTASDSTTMGSWKVTLNRSLNVYFDMTDISLTYYSFSYVKNGEQAPRKRYQLNGEKTLPTYAEKVNLNAGDYFVVTAAKQETSTTSKLVVWLSYTDASIALSDNVQVDVNQIKNLDEKTIPQAPDDGNVYARMGNEWVRASTGIVSGGQEIKNIETDLSVTFRWGSVAMQESKGIGSDGSMIDSTSNNVWVITLSAPIAVYFDMDKIPLTYYAFSCIKDGVQQPRKRYQKTGDHTLPTYEEKIELSAGDTIYLCGSKTEVTSLSKLKIWVEYTESKKSLDSSISVDAMQITNANLLSGIDMYVEKSANEIDVYIRNSEGKFIKYPLLHEIKAYAGETTASAFYDCWGIREVALCSMEGAMIVEANLFSHSEAELTSKVPAYNGTMYAVGGEMHGYENVKVENSKRDVLLRIDGIQVEEDAVVDLKACKSVELVQLTQVYQVGTNVNPYGEVTKRWIFEDGKMTLSASIKFIRELELDHIYIGLMGIYRRWEGNTANSYLTSRAVKNNKPFKIFNIEDGWNDTDIGIRDSDCTKIDVWGDMNVSAYMEVLNHSTATNQGMLISTNNTVYNKIYYQVVGNVANTSVGSEYSAKIVWSII